jgi:site-specific DNA-adenine methylase
MRLENYRLAKESDKIKWLNSLKMKVGLPYFGGKSVIGRYIFNNIFNLSVEMKEQGNTPHVFIDAFTGGGKMGLSVPKGWYDTIVINDLDYGVYSYYKCCKENHIALIYMIEKIGDMMNKEVFHLASYMRRFGTNVVKWETIVNNMTIPVKTMDDEVVDPLVAGALTYWVTSAAFNNITKPEKTTYNLVRIKRDKAGNPVSSGSNMYAESKAEEQENIRKIIARAKKNIPKIHEQLNSRNYIIENLDYRELIKKYNGKEYRNIQEPETLQPAECEWADKNKLWYFDPPYHPLCLYVGDDAPYADTFSESMANEMVDILAGEKEEEFGKIRYFIKSDYDPLHILSVAKIEINNPATKFQYKKWYTDIIHRENNNQEISNLFKKIEEYPFCKICVGGFDKGSVLENGEKGVGQEYIWCRGFSKGYENIEGVEAKA